MTQTLEIPIAAEPTAETWPRRVALGSALGALSVSAFAAQQLGVTSELPEVPQAVVESMSHPALGYLGALVSVGLVDKLGVRFPKLAAAIAGGTVANFGTEIAQDTVFNMFGKSVFFLSENQMGETAKDYAFALAGVAIYALSERISRRKKETMLP